MQNRNRQPDKAVPQSVVLVMAIGFFGLVAIGFIFRKHLEF